MALTKVTYTDDVTVIGAQNLNAIQDEIISLETVTYIATGTDLNNITTPGVYRIWGEYENSPTTGNVYGFMQVYNMAAITVQVYWGATASGFYYRGYTNAQWYDWRRIMQGYVNANTVSISAYAIFAGAWTNSTTLRFLIPTLETSPRVGTPIITGKINLYCDGGTKSNLELGNGNTVTVTAVTGGFAVQVAFASSPDFAKQFHSVGVQAVSGLAITFT